MSLFLSGCSSYVVLVWSLIAKWSILNFKGRLEVCIDENLFLGQNDAQKLLVACCILPYSPCGSVSNNLENND